MDNLGSVDGREAFFAAVHKASGGLNKSNESAENCLDDFWKDIAKRYGEEWRRYHTMDHILEMLALCRRHCPDEIVASPAVVLATIFHDIIYMPKERDNEEESALLFEQFASASALSTTNPGLCTAVNDMILATKSHYTSAHADSESTADSELHYLLDLDMAVLGRPAEGYKLYAAQIRQEYIHVPDEAFKQGRGRVLRGFLDQKHIFATAEFRKSFEERARSNIRAELETLC